jgi:hypothetical protein
MGIDVAPTMCALVKCVGSWGRPFNNPFGSSWSPVDAEPTVEDACRATERGQEEAVGRAERLGRTPGGGGGDEAEPCGATPSRAGSPGARGDCESAERHGPSDSRPPARSLIGDGGRPRHAVELPTSMSFRSVDRRA